MEGVTKVELLPIVRFPGGNLAAATRGAGQGLGVGGCEQLHGVEQGGLPGVVLPDEEVDASERLDGERSEAPKPLDLETGQHVRASTREGTDPDGTTESAEGTEPRKTLLCRACPVWFLCIVKRSGG